MKKKHPYDNSLSEKMEQLPLPDVQQNWQEMRRLLEDEMPRGGGYSKRRGGWWLFGTLLIFIITGSWLLTTSNYSRQNADPPVTKRVNNSPPRADETAGNVLNNSEKPKAADDQILHKEKNKIKNSLPASGGDNRTAAEVPSGDVIKRTPEYSGISKKSARGLIVDFKAEGSAQNVPGISKRRKAQLPRTTKGGEDVRETAVIKAGEPALTTSLSTARLPGETISPANDAYPSELTGPSAAKAIDIAHQIVSARYIIDSADLHKMLVLDYTPVSRKYYRQNKKNGTPANIRQPYTTAGRTFAIGLSLPLGFPLGDQKMLGYNSNAGPNTITDYLPAPNIQYHFSGKSYIQTELQFMSPQFIRPVLLYQDHYSTPNYSTTNSITARKLYYFNLPVSVHYSPFRHFYMGTGLQFSSLVSGIAMREQYNTGMVPGGSIYKVSYSKFNDDSLSNRMNGNEMRLMLDANYYWNKFTVGLRYNQALSNYVSMRAAPTVPYSIDKNKALQFYMRYNLWEDKKRSPALRRTTVKR